MHVSSKSFLYYVTSKHKAYFIFALVTGVLYFIILRFIYPVPSYYSDSFTWIGAAKTNQPITFRPVGYSKLIIFFKIFSQTDIALVAAQYFCNLLANLFLFFTCLWFFPMRKTSKNVLYLLLIVHPFYLFASNYISSDAFFDCLSVFWFTLLIWIMHKASSLTIVVHLLVLAGLFLLRYNAVYFPIITTMALLLSPQIWWKKIAYVAASCIIILSIVFYVTVQTRQYAGTKTFSAFSGWQLANNALHILAHDKIDTTEIKDREVKDLLAYTTHFFDTTRQTFPDSTASAVYMWHINSPLKKYMGVYPARKKTYFGTWNALGPVYSKFGETVILQQPGSYLKHFVLPNVNAYFFPDLEVYESYMEKADTVALIAQRFYQYKSNTTLAQHTVVYDFVFKPVKYFFTAVNLLFLVIVLYYWIAKKYVRQQKLFNRALVCFILFYLANFFFVVLLAPSVIRYHIFIFTLLLPLLVYLMQQIAHPLSPLRIRKKRTQVKN